MLWNLFLNSHVNFYKEIYVDCNNIPRGDPSTSNRIKRMRCTRRNRRAARRAPSVSGRASTRRRSDCTGAGASRPAPYASSPPTASSSSGSTHSSPGSSRPAAADSQRGFSRDPPRRTRSSTLRNRKVS